MMMNQIDKVNTLPFSSFLFDRIWHTHIEGFGGQREVNWWELQFLPGGVRFIQDSQQRPLFVPLSPSGAFAHPDKTSGPEIFPVKERGGQSTKTISTKTVL
jgi:hypothetical protein